jgi:hypothetical protein
MACAESVPLDGLGWGEGRWWDVRTDEVDGHGRETRVVRENLHVFLVDVMENVAGDDFVIRVAHALVVVVVPWGKWCL